MEKMKIQFVQFGHNCWEDCTPSPEVAAAKPNVKNRAFRPGWQIISIKMYSAA